MRCIIVGLGIQGKKRRAVAGSEAVATVDPCESNADYQSVEQVPLDSFDAALVCTPDEAKIEILEYLLSHKKHVLVEKPLVSKSTEDLVRLKAQTRFSGAACYTAYNHRFEPNLVRLKELVDDKVLGKILLAKLFYGNGTAADVRNSPWRDKGLGVVADLGSHLLDLVDFLFDKPKSPLEVLMCNRLENNAPDHVLIGTSSGVLKEQQTQSPKIELEATLVSWLNTFSVDVYGDKGSAHINCLCKWGPSTITVRHRVFPSGKPNEESETLVRPDPTWAAEYQHFKSLCATGGTNIDNDIWINEVLSRFATATQGAEECAA